MTASNPVPVLAQQYKVLVVDDDPTNLTLATEVIRHYGALPGACSSALGALEEFTNSSWDLVFMDIRLPGMSGLEVADAFREIEAATLRRRVPIIALTASVLPSEKSQCYQHGMDGVLEKPYSLAKFKAVLDQWRNPQPEESPALSEPEGDRCNAGRR